MTVAAYLLLVVIGSVEELNEGGGKPRNGLGEMKPTLVGDPCQNKGCLRLI
jgi:hypothetical protein